MPPGALSATVVWIARLWRRFPGLWEVRVMESNPSAIFFWNLAISDFIRESIRPVRIEKDGKSWQLYSFKSEVS
jgi:hypothetical protein